MEKALNLFRLNQFSKINSIKHLGWIIIGLKIVMASYLFTLIFQGIQHGEFELGEKFLWFIAAGFLAQLIDGALGMAYGVSCTSLLLWLGIPPKFASASVHTSEIFTTGASGLSHIRFDNIDKKLFFQIVITGVIGAIIGAYLIADFFDGTMVKPFISLYLLFLGVFLLFKAFKKKQQKKKEVKKAPLLAFVGGLLDAIGGGGWGPIVTSNLLSQGKSARYTIGTVNTAEFFVTYFATAIFIFFLGIQHLEIVLGLIIGGVAAAPIGAYVTSRINQRVLLFMVGIIVVLISSWGIYSAWF